MDGTQPSLQRASIRQLLEAAFHPGATLTELGARAGAATWLERTHVLYVDVLAGKIPVRWTHEDRVFVIDVCPSVDEDDTHQLAVYLRVAGEPELDTVVAALRGEAGAADHEVREIGFFESED